MLNLLHRSDEGDGLFGGMLGLAADFQSETLGPDHGARDISHHPFGLHPEPQPKGVCGLGGRKITAMTRGVGQTV